MMKFISWILGLFFASTIVAYETPVKLGIEEIYKPADCEPTASQGNKVKVHYTGTLHKTGVKFDSSLDRGEPLGFTLGAGQVIKGWDQGIKGMCVKQKRKLTIPPDLAYGERGFGSIIPSNSALVFEVELISFDQSSRDEL